LAKAYKKRVLGRGLSAILSDNDNNRFSENRVNSISKILIDDIKLNPNQPRTNFDQKAIEELASSIKELGLIQPITIQKNNDSYELISGERRLRAFKFLNLNEIPAYVREADDQTSLEMALVENIQRKDLDPIEIAISYKRLIEELKISHDQMSKRVGKDRSTITNYMRLLKLDPIIQSGIRDEFISMGHGRALIGIGSHDIQLSVYEKILKNKLSVRQTEDLIKNLNGTKKDKKFKNIDSDVIKIIDEINKKFDYNLKISLQMRTYPILAFANGLTSN
jgi:ParB family chromosome partitioning protein